MTNPQLENSPVAKTGMLIRRPVADVFAAFIDPEVTTKFWFTKSSGRLEPGKQVKWEWEMYGASTQVTVQAIEANKRIVIEWDDTAAAPMWNGSSYPKRRAQRSSALRSRAGRVTATNLSATCQTPLRGSLGLSQVSKLCLSRTSD